jgi:hypothetical protein
MRNGIYINKINRLLSVLYGYFGHYQYLKKEISMRKDIRILMVGTNLLFALTTFAQTDFISEDYKNFGRKIPVTTGSAFSALGTSTIFVNPANLAFVADNQINYGGNVSDQGGGMFIAWTAPNLSISSADQKLTLNDATGQEHKKQLLNFCFALSTEDIGYSGDNFAIAAGFAIKRQADWLYDANSQRIGGDAISIDVGFLFKWNLFAFELTALDINSPQLGDSGIQYGRGFIVGGRYTTPAGFMIALQGIGGDTYAGSDLGLNIAAEQSFFNHRLVSRVQLTSFFDGSNATMQNVSGGIGYRPRFKNNKLMFLEDLEFSYSLSFLALPVNIGTHLVVITKYF